MTRNTAETERSAGDWAYLISRFNGILAGLQPSATEAAVVVACTAHLRSTLARAAAGRRSRRDEAIGLVLIGSHANATALPALMSAASTVAGASRIDALAVLPDDWRPRLTSHGVADRRYLLPAQRLASTLGEQLGEVETCGNGWIGLAPGLLDPAAPAIRLLPAFACGAGGYRVPATAGRHGRWHWRQVAPKAQGNRLAAIEGISRGKVRPLIRLLKAWRVACGARITGFALELLACEFLSVWLYHRRSPLFYDWMLRDGFFWLAAQAGRRLAVPGTLESIGVGTSWADAARVAHTAASFAADAERDNDWATAGTHWRRIFGTTFGGG